jgi:uncharacterized membrane protein HdeD (DUF308 family)
MNYWFTPDAFHLTATSFSDKKWRLLAWSALAFVLYLLLETQITSTTPTFLIWLALAILFASIQTLIIASFIFFFQVLPSKKANSSLWYKFYRVIEWSETLLFTFLLPLPTLIFIYALLKV